MRPRSIRLFMVAQFVCSCPCPRRGRLPACAQSVLQGEDSVYNHLDAPSRAVASIINLPWLTYPFRNRGFQPRISLAGEAPASTGALRMMKAAGENPGGAAAAASSSARGSGAGRVGPWRILREMLTTRVLPGRTRRACATVPDRERATQSDRPMSSTMFEEPM